MALFISQTKTSLCSDQGPASGKKFIADRDRDAVTIKVEGEKKNYSITLYGEEVEQLKKLFNDGSRESITKVG